MEAQYKSSILMEKTFLFSLAIIRFTSGDTRFPSYDLRRQLFRSGTSIGANTREAQGDESRTDFIHKLKIAYKEAEETEYWLMLCDQSAGYPAPGNLLDEIRSIKRILGKIITTARNNMSKGG